MTDATDATVPTPKPWHHSSTIWSGVAQIAAGLVMVALGVLLPEQHGDLVMVGVGALTTGVATVRGRVAATRPIRPLGA